MTLGLFYKLFSVAAHVIDGLLDHEADLSSDVHHTDGGGVSDQVFGLAHLLGFRFAPRIPKQAQWPDAALLAFLRLLADVPDAEVLWIVAGGEARPAR